MVPGDLTPEQAAKLVYTCSRFLSMTWMLQSHHAGMDRREVEGQTARDIRRIRALAAENGIKDGEPMTTQIAKDFVMAIAREALESLEFA